MPDLRDFLSQSEREKDVFKVREEVSARFEVAAIVKRLEAEKVVFFERVRESKIPVVAGICGNRNRICRGLGVSGEGKLYEAILQAMRSPTRPKVVEDGPVKEVVEPPNLGRFPILTHHEKDGGPYITSAIVSARSPDGEVENVSIHRLQVIDKTHLAIRLVPRHLYRMHQMVKQGGKNLDVAISVGVHPALSLAAASPAPFGMSEFDVANSLMGGRLKTLKCWDVDAYAPSDAEIVFEGRILAGKEVAEGPFVDLTGTYDIVRQQPVVELLKTFRRESCLYQALLPAGCEHRVLMGMAREAKIWEMARNVVPTVKSVNLTDGGCGWLHASISLEKQSEGDARNVILAAFAAHPSLKHVVVVDSDIDVHDPVNVEWAVATRFQGDRGLLILPNVRGSTLDPSSNQQLGLGTKVGFDATAPLTKPKEKFFKGSIPDEEKTCKRVLSEKA